MTASREWLQRMRQRPGMYVGDVGGYGLHRLPLWLLQLGATAASEGRGTEVRLRLEEGGACTFSFDGLLWPKGLVPEPPGDALERMCSWTDRTSPSPKPDWGPVALSGLALRDVLALVSGLSSKCELVVVLEDKTWRQSFVEGEPAGPVREVLPPVGNRPAVKGTRIRFVPDRSIFESTRLSVLGLSRRMEELAALHPGVSFWLNDDVRQLEERHGFARGLVEYSERLSQGASPLHAPWFFEGRTEEVRVRLSLQWCRGPGSRVVTWVNQFRALGGAHAQGLLQGIAQAQRHYVQMARRVPDYWLDDNASLTEGLTALLDVSVPQPVWYGPIKGQLANPECEDDVARLVGAWLSERFEQESLVATQVLDQHVGRCVAKG
ncbi:hypothetical protein [Melittangium boletus]|uniref:hypothetical protein n=1 Tax=Melittangium boletus TaxID=83453 RepID=UPI003DA1E656